MTTKCPTCSTGEQAVTLLELMLKEKVKWPVGAEFAMQDDGGENIKFGRGRTPTLCGTGVCAQYGCWGLITDSRQIGSSFIP